MMIKTLFLISLFLVTNLVLAESHDRWYTNQQVIEGKNLFLKNCAVCHGKNAQATANWKQTDANGKYPPPPLNGTAHAWHHDLELLRETVREGGIKLGGVMPAFGEKLSSDDVDRVIAYFQSKWPEETYQKWSGRFGVADLPSLADIQEVNYNQLTRHLVNRLGDTQVGKPEKTGVEGVWQVKLKNRYIYLIKDGQYALTGDLINLQDGQNLTENYRRTNVIDALSRYDEKDMIIYEPNGIKKATLTVFTDTSCPYCKKLHEEVPQLLNAGIRVRYLPYARGGKNGPGYQALRSVWCSKDRHLALTNAKQGKLDGLSPGDCAQAKVVDRAFRTGAEVGVTGTPALFKSNGEQIVGYVPYQKLISQVVRQ